MNCGYDIAAHAQDTVSPSSIQKVLESVENIPSLIESNIYLGGFVAAMNMNFLKSKYRLFKILDEKRKKLPKIASCCLESNCISSHLV